MKPPTSTHAHTRDAGHVRAYLCMHAGVYASMRALYARTRCISLLVYHQRRSRVPYQP